ncbi:hypothetical protein HanPI659440_Chr16g0644921 [Helianthus annuus]|nr:hypothetical protein HanPI659440_Chr16g0644921 [Helianthus annuus]
MFLTGKKEKNMITEHEKACATKIAELEESLKKKKQVTYLFLTSTCWLMNGPFRVLLNLLWVKWLNKKLRI